MKKQFISLALLCLAGLIHAQNGAYIEYKITSSRGANGSAKVNFSEFGSVSVFNMIIPQMPGGGMTIKSLTQKNSPELIYMINDNNKTYSEKKRSDMANEDNKTYTVKKLGEETVNGYKCVHAMITEGAETHEVWNTKDVADYAKYAESFKSNSRMGSAKREQALKDAGCDGLPVKSFHKGNAREGDMTMELVKIEKKNFTSADFDIPAGYTKTEGMGLGAPAVKSQQEIMSMSPEERAKYIEEMKKMRGK
jgi:hypothetical protein